MAYDRKQGRHEVAQSSRPDYRLEVGRAEVPVGEPRDFVVLDPSRAAILTAWTAALIPAAGRRPDAGSVGAAEYIDATVHLVPVLRPALFHAIDRVESLALELTGHSFTRCGAEQREQVLRQFQAVDDSDAFSMVSDFTYESYYGHPDVLAAMETENGWRGMVPMTGTVMAPFDASRLQRVRALPPRYRGVDAAKEMKA
ncbi:MAG TPA: gluconate 2-dehydrogenase subunit 3 family protein [Candidatus Dormibacteraeota bacterium]|nr:gluconate 2-dehydrogenase subunit 3 family protein [Candidatus Dormibacteraeota bacterium]